VVLRFTTHRSCIRQLFALQHTDKSSVMQAIVGPTKRFHHMRDVDPRGTRVVQKPIAEREPDKLPIAFRPGDVLLASSPVGSLTKGRSAPGAFFCAVGVEGGQEVFEVLEHPGPRPSSRKWQG